MVALPAQFGDEVGHGWRVADRHDPPHAGTLGTHSVQPLAQAVPDTQVEDRHTGQCDQDVTTGEVELDRVGGDRHRGGQADRRVQHLAELLRANPDIAGAIASGHRYDPAPEQGQRERESQVDRREVVVAVSADLERQQSRRQRTGAIGKDRPSKIRVGPCCR